MNRTRIKVCGITSVSDAEFAVNCGVDAIGLNFFTKSPRYIEKSKAIEIRKVVPAFVTLVGIFVDAEQQKVQEHYNEVGLDLLQLHGAETEQYCDSLALPYIKALRVRDVQQLEADMVGYKQARAFLLDPYVKGTHGGTGKQLDESLWPSSVDKKLILAGGLSTNNISSAITNMKPYAVDVNSGVEDEPGVKNHKLLRQFIETVNSL